MGSIPGQGTEIPHAAGGGQINQKQTEQQNTVVNQRSLSRKGKRCITEWETMSANHRSEKGLVCRTGKNCYNRTEDNPTGKWARGLADTPPKTVHRRPKEHVKRCSTPVSHPVQFSSVQSDSLRPHESQHARPPCPSPTPGVHSDSRPSSR